MMDGRACRKIVLPGYLSGSSETIDDALGAFGRNLMGDLRDGEPAFGRLAAGHRDRVVVKNLVGDVDARGRGSAHRQQAGMGVGAVADVLKDVRFIGEGRLPDPGRRPRRPYARSSRCGDSGPTSAMPWQPMPAMARLPSGIFVEVLCGQPGAEIRRALQLGRRRRRAAGRSKASSRARRCSSAGLR